MPEDGRLNNSFETIRLRFVKKLVVFLSVLERLVATRTHSETEADSLENIRMQVHKLAGSARTFGFPGLSALAVVAEDQLDRVIDAPTGAPLPLALHRALEPLIAESRRITQTFRSGDARVLPHAPPLSERYSTVQTEASPNRSNAWNFSILVADDDELVRDLIQLGFANEGCSVVEAEDGARALHILELVKKHKSLATPDLILLDVNMPDMSGFEVLDRIKADPALRDIPVIMLTRRDEDESVINGITAGVSDYITKPFDLTELVDRIMTGLRRSRTRILIADDDDLVCELLKHRFQRMGYSVIIADNGTDALARMQADRPDVTILDVMMPGMQGFAVLNQIRNTAETSDLPVIILSAKGQQENILKGLETGANDYITKPFDLDEVAVRVSNMLRLRKSA